MPAITQILDAAAAGDQRAAAQILPLVYDELRKLAAARMAAEAPGHTLDATALVHEAYLRLTGGQRFDGRGHFFAAAAEAMRRILVDAARRKAAQKHGGGRAPPPLQGSPKARGRAVPTPGRHRRPGREPAAGAGEPVRPAPANHHQPER